MSTERCVQDLSIQVLTPDRNVKIMFSYAPEFTSTSLSPDCGNSFFFRSLKSSPPVGFLTNIVYFFVSDTQDYARSAYSFTSSPNTTLFAVKGLLTGLS